MDLTARTASRRRFLMTAAALAGSAAIAACSPQQSAAPAKPAESKPAEAAKPTEAAKPAAPAATTAPAAAARPTEVQSPLAAAKPAAPAAAAKPADTPAGLKPVPRNRTLMTALQGRDGKLYNPDIWSPYTVGSDTSNMNQIIFEPLAYFSVFANKEILWTAESYEYTPDFKQLTIKIRKDISWSDDKPFTAEDVAYTFTTLKSYGAKVRWGSDIAQYVDTATAADPQTVKIVFRAPAPRFFDFISYKYDIGVPIVPKHVFDGQDWPSFKNFDLAKGWPLTTGAWKVMYAAPEQKIVDRRDNWWGAKAGIAELPKVERIILICWVGEQQVVQSLINNELDFCYSLQPATFPAVFKANPKIITHSGTKLPYGYEDWWPIGLWLNNERKPFDDKDMRWGLSYLIDREKLVEVGWSGASAPSPLPIPGYAPLQPYFDATKPLLEKYPTNLYDPKKGEALLNGKGWKKNGQGVFADASGNTLKLEIIGSGTAGNALGPILLELLKREGIDASFSLPPDFGDRFAKGEYYGAINGHGGSVRDPYNTMRLYQTQTEVIPGLLTLTNLARWKNSDFDKLTDQVYQTDMKNIPKLTELWTKAMEIWLPELPDVQLTKFHHRIPMNTTYWTNYPTEENPYVNGALWALTYGYTLTMLKPTQ